MKALLLLSLIILNVTAIERKVKSKSESSTKETVEEESQLIQKVLSLRQGYNLNLGSNELDRIEDLDFSSDQESQFLLENIDTFGVQKNFDSLVKSQILSDNQYFTEIVAKLQDANKSDPVEQIIKLWQNDQEILEHLKLEYNQVGCSCKQILAFFNLFQRLYGNGRICVMHLRLY